MTRQTISQDERVLSPETRLYREWIDRKIASADPFTKCAAWTLEMQSIFPELQRVAGFVFLSNGWEREHWWLKTADGVVIDPTASQFGQAYYSGGSEVLHYCELDERERPTGKCHNCGEYCYGGRTELCSESCQIAYVAYINASLRGMGSVLRVE